MSKSQLKNVLLAAMLTLGVALMAIGPAVVKEPQVTAEYYINGMHYVSFPGGTTANVTRDSLTVLTLRRAK